MLEVKNLTKIYKTKGGLDVKALDDVSVNFPEKGMVFLLGRSGSGKSTLLNMAGGLDRPTSGEIIVKGRSSKDFSASDFDSYRNTYIGFVFQEYNVLNEFTVEQNISLALQLQGKPNDVNAVNEILKKVEMESFGKRKPNTLSGGQKQRIAIARALIKNPEIIMADEPTGALDSNTGKQVLDTLKELSKEKLVIVVSHDREFAEYYGDRIIELKDGRILSDEVKTLTPAKDVSENVKVAGNTLSISDTSKLTKADMNKIFDILKEKSGETVITTGEEEVKEVKRAIRLHDGGERESFIKTEKVEVKEYDGKDTQFIKSKLPARHALKIGASGLKVKPFRLILTMFLSIVSFTFFGLFSTFMLYNSAYSVSEALKEADYKSVSINKNYKATIENVQINHQTFEQTVDEEYSYETTVGVRFGESDVEKFNQNNVGLNFAGAFNFANENYGDGYWSLNCPRIENENICGYYSSNNVYGFSDCGEEYLKSCSFPRIAGDHYPENSSEIAVSEYVYELYKESNALVLNTPNDFIGKEITLSRSGVEIKATVCAVYRTEKSGELKDKYQKLLTSDKLSDLNEKERQKLISKMQDELRCSYYTLCYVSSDFYDTYKDNFGMSSLGYNYYTYYVTLTEFLISGDSLSGRSVTESDYTETYLFSFVKESPAITFYDLNKNKIHPSEMQDNEVYVPLVMEGVNKVNYLGKSKSGSLNVVGYFTTDNSYMAYVLNDNFIKDNAELDYDLWLTVEKTDYVSQENLKYSALISLTDNGQSQLNFMLEDKDNDVVCTINKSVYEEMNFMVTLIKELKNVFLTIGIVFGVFSALMLLNFISVSITAKKKEIGILRAVGARGVDVFKIFFAEALIISFICFTLASVSSGLVCSILNKELVKVITVKILNFGLVNVGLIFAISLIISAVATFIPVFFASRKPPVESIRAL